MTKKIMVMLQMPKRVASDYEFRWILYKLAVIRRPPSRGWNGHMWKYADVIWERNIEGYVGTFNDFARAYGELQR